MKLTLELKISLREALLPDHLARFLVDLVAPLDFSCFYARYRAYGGSPYAPELLFCTVTAPGYSAAVRLNAPPMNRFLFGSWLVIGTQSTIRLPIFGDSF